MCENLNFLNVYNFGEGFVTELINVPRKEEEKPQQTVRRRTPN